MAESSLGEVAEPRHVVVYRQPNPLMRSTDVCRWKGPLQREESQCVEVLRAKEGAMQVAHLLPVGGV